MRADGRWEDRFIFPRSTTGETRLILATMDSYRTSLAPLRAALSRSNPCRRALQQGNFTEALGHRSAPMSWEGRSKGRDLRPYNDSAASERDDIRDPFSSVAS